MYYKNASGNLKIDRTTHYYPFGLEFGGDLNISLSISPNYKYSTQGQEKQTETGWSSYRWRNYDPAMGRFFNVDPLSEKYNYIKKKLCLNKLLKKIKNFLTI
ncbi:RHS repeat-associated core domain-containing protein [Chryseobacterium sp. MEBOG07]|uniref:RHS repeat-associated core domain-containing protein n=1 Tax=Chryseobacterium sp. MEBOG07 TaxID=2879939 RepID=UPI001F341B44|nr:RHS repeat-associated core domain-containing protein [Chryseobacterium sp. MEBOG07]UKB81347.1 hypothetical protein LF886_10245 [Chryseobacterium sp. MEBOG07]